MQSKIYLTEGRTHDSVPAIDLLSNLIAKSLIGDKAYDSFKIIDVIENQNIKSVISSRKTNLVKRIYDKDKYRKRNLIERFFSKIKHFIRIATRYEKLVNKYELVALIGFIIV